MYKFHQYLTHHNKIKIKAVLQSIKGRNLTIQTPSFQNISNCGLFFRQHAASIFGFVGLLVSCVKIFFTTLLRGPIKIKNVPKSGKSPKGGGGVSEKNQKVQNLKFGLFDKRGVQIFKFFPNVNEDYFETVNASVGQKISQFLSDFQAILSD